VGGLGGEGCREMSLQLFKRTVDAFLNLEVCRKAQLP
jgi:hypothetical protein